MILRGTGQAPDERKTPVAEPLGTGAQKNFWMRHRGALSQQEALMHYPTGSPGAPPGGCPREYLGGRHCPRP